MMNFNIHLKYILNSQASGGRAGHVLVSFSNILAGLLIAFICSWKLAALVFIVVPILLYIGYQQQTMQKRHQMRDNKKFEEAGKVCMIFVLYVFVLSRLVVAVKCDYRDHILWPVYIVTTFPGEDD